MRFVAAALLTLAACKADAPKAPPPAPKAQADPAPKPAPPPPDADVMPGAKLGPLTLGQAPPQGHDGSRSEAGGAKVLYWSELGVQATLDRAGKVASAGAHGPDSDPFFRQAFAGKTAEGVGIGAKAADAQAKLGPCQEKPAPSAFVSSRVTLSCKAAGLTLDLSKPGGDVIAMWVTPKT